MHIKRIALLLSLLLLFTTTSYAAHSNINGTPERLMDERSFPTLDSPYRDVFYELMIAGIVTAEDATASAAGLMQALTGTESAVTTRQEVVHALCSSLGIAPKEGQIAALMQFADFGYIAPEYRDSYIAIADRITADDGYLLPTTEATFDHVLEIAAAVRNELFSARGITCVQAQVTESSADQRSRTVKLSAGKDTYTVEIAHNERIMLIRDGQADLFERSIRAGEQVRLLVKDGTALAISVIPPVQDDSLRLYRGYLYYSDRDSGQMIFTNLYREKNGIMEKQGDGFTSLTVAPVLLCYRGEKLLDYEQLNLTVLDKAATLLTDEKNRIVYLNVEE